MSAAIYKENNRYIIRASNGLEIPAASMTDAVQLCKQYGFRPILGITIKKEVTPC